MTEPGRTLNQLRGEIDRLDDALVDLLVRRARVAAELAPLKAGAPLLRPGREAEILRRLAAAAGPGFDRAALVRIWREIMSAALRRQGPFSVAVSAPAGGPACWTLARDQYGAGTPMVAAAGPARAIAAVAAGAAEVAVVPFPSEDDADPWWPRLMVEGEAPPRVIARLPVAAALTPPDGCTDGLAVAPMAPEPSGEDRSWLGIETAAETGRDRVARALAGAGFESVRVQAGAGRGGGLYLADLAGFVEPGATGLAHLAASLGHALVRVVVIGAYAVPLPEEPIP